MGDFSSKVVLVTGGSRGIGRACVVAFAKAGATVVLTYAGNDAAAEETVRLAGGPTSAVKFDVADTAACARAVEDVVKKHGRLDVLVNNAGVAIDGLSMRLKDEDWDKQLDTNLKGAFALSRAAARPMMKQRSGRHHQPRLGGGGDGQRRPGGLRREQGGADGPHQSTGAGAGQP